MPVRVGLNVWSRLVEHTFPYLDRTAGPFDSLWFPDHVQYGSHRERLKASPDTRPLADIHVVGTPAQVTDVLRGVLRQGAHRLTVNFADVPAPDGTLLFAETVLPHLEAA
jgi:hypothetical protein